MFPEIPVQNRESPGGENLKRPFLPGESKYGGCMLVARMKRGQVGRGKGVGVPP